MLYLHWNTIATQAWIVDETGEVRATMFSVRGQVDAIGQITSGPVVGMVGNASIRAALVASAAILSPVLPLYWIAMRRDE
jgi:DHA3 family tetracycline resistance protein-like MFS transporter